MSVIRFPKTLMVAALIALAGWVTADGARAAQSEGAKTIVETAAEGRVSSPRW